MSTVAVAKIAPVKDVPAPSASVAHPLLELQGIVQEYPVLDEHGHTKSNVRVVDGVSLKFDKPGLNMLLGPSGCGKSTVLRMMGGVRPNDVVTPTSGNIFINGLACTGPSDDAVTVFQKYANRPDQSVWDNVYAPFKFKMWRAVISKDEAEKRTRDVLEAVGLLDKKNLRPAQLSGGQNQRVALARALALQPRILLMDEPFGALDAQTRSNMQEMLTKLYLVHPCLVVFVTHDVTEALTLGDRVIVMSTSPARIADDFLIAESHPRSIEWQQSAFAKQLQERILNNLHHNSEGGRGKLTVHV